MIKRPDGMNAFEFAVLSGLRAAQLQRGCTPRVPPSEKVAVTAQHELAERKILRCADSTPPSSEPVADEEREVARSSDEELVAARASG
jgi:DNA-directed RNA polymerase subunit K/omega